jgi:eukaryotic-like serine/threonine-protein kinase
MAHSAPSNGAVLGHYRVLEKLGAGGMGVVFKAFDLQLERIVALKFLPEDAALNQQDKQRLLQEARAASALDHPNIGAIYGIEEHEGQLFIVMAYYEGDTLAALLTRGPGVSLTLDLIAQVARGLAAAHARNIIHRDIKPSNLIVTRDGTVKIVDFGLAKVVASASMTQSLHTSGTLPYMSPEQLLGEPISPACDVWALGVIFVQVLTGRHPFSRDNPGAITHAILNVAPEGADLLPVALQPVVYKALAKQVDRRHPSAKEFLIQLDAARAELTAGSLGVVSDGATRTRISSRELKRYTEYASLPRTGAAATKSRAWIYALLATVVLVVAFVGWRLTPRGRNAESTPPLRNHIAVLPFDNLGGNPADDALAAGLMDTLSGELSNINAGQQTLWVVPASIVRSHKITDPAAAAKELGVDLVVKGSLQRSASDVRLNVDLIDAHSLRELGSASLADRTGDLSSLQDEAVARLARLMKLNVTADMLRNTGGRASPAAYELYLKALGYLQRYDKPGNLDNAITALNDALKLDPQFALGFASLGEAYRLRNQVDPNQKWVDQALANLDQAVTVDNRLPAPYVSLGRLHSTLGKSDLALQEFQKALAINPRDPDAIMGVAAAYERMGRVADAERSFKKAIDLRPDYWDGYNSLGFFYYRQQRYQEAIAQFRRELELTPDNATAYSNLAGVLLVVDDAKSRSEAEIALKRSLQLSPSYAAYANLGRLYLALKRYPDAAEMTRKALDLNDHDYAVWANLLIAYQWMNDRSHADDARAHTLALLEKHVAAHPQDARARSSLSNFYAEANNRGGAEREIAAALALAPTDSSVLADVAETYEDLGEHQKALEFARKTLQNGGSLDDFQIRVHMQKLLADPAFQHPGTPKQ